MGGLRSPEHEALHCTGSLYVLTLCLDPAGPTLLCKGRGWLQSLPRAPSTLYPLRDMLVLQDTLPPCPFPSLPIPAGQGQLRQPRGVGGRTPLHAQCNSPKPKRSLAAPAPLYQRNWRLY